MSLPLTNYLDLSMSLSMIFSYVGNDPKLGPYPAKFWMNTFSNNPSGLIEL